MENKTIYITQIDHSRKLDVCYDVVMEFTEAVLSDREIKAINYNSFADNRYVRAILKRNIPFINSVIANKGDKIVFSIAMGINAEPGMIHSRMARKKAIYLFDAWPDKYSIIEDAVKRNSTGLLFVSSLQSANELSRRLPFCKVIWCPEGCNARTYRIKPYNERKYDILALGRKYHLLHQNIIENKLSENWNYLYEKIAGQVIFPTRDSFLEGLASSKILICYPRSITTPESAGNIETMTNRYLQGMSSKVLLVGHCPAEMIDLFGYNPVIELDMRNAVAQLSEIITDFESYIPLIEKNYTAVIEKHQWINRWDFIKGKISEFLF